MNVFDAPVDVNRPVPAFRVIQIDEPFTHIQHFFDEKTKKICKREVEKEGGFMVEFPRGHSIFVDSLADLEAKGFGSVVPLIKMDGESELVDDADKSVRVTLPIKRNKED